MPVTNSIICGNVDASGSNQIAGDAAAISVSYSDVEGGWTGAGNIDADPRLVDAVNVDPVRHDYRIKFGSGAVDKQVDASAALTIDIHGDLRPLDGNGIPSAYEYDMGADEFPGNEQGHCTDGLDNDGDGKLDCQDRSDCRKDPACP